MKNIKLSPLLIVAMVFLSPTVLHAQDNSMQFRFMSHVVRDRAPSVQEAKDFHNNMQPIESYTNQWLASPEHAQRVQRFFQDMFGASPYQFISQDEYDLILENGVYRLSNSIKPSCGGSPVQKPAWWSDQPIWICPSAVSEQLKFNYQGTNLECARLSTNGLFHAACGCGKEQIACFPKELKQKITAAVAREFQDRAYYVYQTGKSWNELFGSQMFFGNRWLFHFYLYQQKILAMSEQPTAQEYLYLKSLPIDQKVEALNPVGAARSGIATSPAFLKQFNNFRSRTRAIVERLLCKDIDPSLNTSGITTFVNPSLSAFDKAHGAQANCAGCHYAMDNVGSAMLGWDDNGFYQSWAPPSQQSHVFGQDGSGPEFMMNRIIEEGPGFATCMAKTVWESFSGVSWNALEEDARERFAEVANDTPRQLIRSVIVSKEMFNMRVLKSSTPVTKTVAVKYDFVRDINPILLQSCAGSSCHSGGTSLGSSFGFVGNETRFRQVILERLGDGTMPPASSGKSISPENRAKLQQFRMGQ